ncbi:MlaD family protein [Roseicitreum antarcticum]|uniref:Phospholipid/cholesterol/gamma-HCH transport system substrate-binding protein n=1 Tax=Roseicitreum antarcticum TaxID=564137 RepID=A0A1H2QI61_9RHOB|nr:MlaD family protein [Roseicitreum antarcticum]SDW06907.1 phospholipid/cholesterol/gamma-HCH transport system substrate-binding protein [Roseicitreum antarcticum]
METRARYILVGVFTLLTMLAALGFILWLAKVQIDRTYAQYDIVFDTVAGLGDASNVRYNGVSVGKVLTIELDAENPALVRVRIEVDAETPVREDTVARLASQGVTGVSFVALEGGRTDAEPLRPQPPADVPVIRAKPSLVQGLMSDAPDLLTEALSLMQDIRAFTTPENRAAVADILQNVKTATARIDQIAAQAESVMATAEVTLQTADATLADARTAFGSADSVLTDDIPALIAELRTAAGDIRQSAAGLRDFSTTGLPQFRAVAGDARALIANISALTNRIASDPGRFLLGNQTPSYRN